VVISSFDEKPMTAKALDTIRTQLVWNRLLAVVEEQAQTLMRTAFSTVVREAGDLSAGVFSPDGAMLAQAVTGTPGHVNAMAASVGKFLQKFPLRTLVSGDALVTNDPWDGTGHLNDFTVVTPIFLMGRAIALFASTSHIADVGGRGFGPDANEVFEEGINVPIGHLFRGGKLNETLLEIVKANVRDPVVAEGDLYSLAACNETGGEQLVKLMNDFKLHSLDGVGAEIIGNSKRAMRDEIANLPNGTYHYAMDVDGYDEPVHIACALTVADYEIFIDFSGSSRLSRFGINVPLNYTEAYASFGVRCIIGNDVPNNAGSLEVIRVSAPTGSILNACRPAAVSARHAVGQMLPDVILGCLEQVVPELVPAEGASCIWNPVLLSLPDSGIGDNSEGDRFVTNPIFNGGTGARPEKDGLSTTAFPSGVRTTPTEVNEVTAPLVIWRKEYLPDSGGPGRLRGGLGQIIEITHAHGEPFEVSKMFDRIRYPARGRHGGAAGRAGRVYVKDGPNLKGKGKETLDRGATLVLETPGGGGIGDPRLRDTKMVEKDEISGLISHDAAKNIYGLK
jgi:N-methylhydantoinase B